MPIYHLIITFTWTVVVKCNNKYLISSLKSLIFWFEKSFFFSQKFQFSNRSTPELYSYPVICYIIELQEGNRFSWQARSFIQIIYGFALKGNIKLSLAFSFLNDKPGVSQDSTIRRGLRPVLQGEAFEWNPKGAF